MTAKKEPPVYDVVVSGAPKGEIYHKNGRWRWFMEGRGTEVFPPSATTQNVISSITHLCRANPLNVHVILRDPKIRKEVEARAQDVIEKVLDGTDTDRIRKMIVDAMYWARNA